MKPIFDRNGNTTAWINNQYVCELRSGEIIAFINSNSIVNLRGRHIGTFTSGFFRDKRGNSVAFVSGATNGPLPPLTQLPPLPPIPGLPPIPPLPQIPPIPPLSSLNWSSLTWFDFINS